MNNQQTEIEKLRATVKVLEEENNQLSERAEDAMLLGLVAEAIEGLTEPSAVIDQVLERISILKNLPFVTCGSLLECAVEKIASYVAFSDEPETGYPIQLTPEVYRELSDGPYLLDDLQNISTGLTKETSPLWSALLIPFHCHQYGDGVFLFFDRQTDGNRLPSMLFLLDQVVRLAIGRLDNIFLSRQLAFLNAELEEQVLLKTKDLRTANTRLTEIYERFVSVLNGVDSYVHVTDTRDYTILFANKTAKELFGEAIEGQKCYQVFRQKNTPCFFCKIPRLLATRTEADQTVTWESLNPLTGKWFLNSERIVDWPDVPAALLTVGTNITDLKKAEEEKQQLAQSLHQAQKMEAIGVLAGSIAHDLNNILSGVVSYPDLLLATMPPDAPLRKPLETIRAAGARATKIVQGLLSLSRRGMQVEEPVDLSRLFSDYLESPEYRELLIHHKKVRVVTGELQKGLVVLGSPAHLSNVLMNLVNNAAEAIQDGGVITLGLERFEFANQPPGFTAWRPGPYARLTISDTGSGIPLEYQERIFEPFFSSKELGRSGTGLGLAVVWGTVTDHHGYIEVASNEGQGTRFHISLPLVKSDKRREVPPEGLPVQGQGQSILLVDDNEQQRLIASEILLHLGYKVRAAESGEAAISTLQDNSFDLVILDMLMPPGIDGLETYKRICNFNPRQKVIIVSGFSQSEQAREALALGALQYVQKPYALAKISQVVHRALLG
ncbi:MAG: response regulator [Proteobacteria bacterium]|nr:response regulator [Pseudomonadota bacterium]